MGDGRALRREGSHGILELEGKKGRGYIPFVSPTLFHVF